MKSLNRHFKLRKEVERILSLPGSGVAADQIQFAAGLILGEIGTSLLWLLFDEMESTHLINVEKPKTAS